MNSKPETIGALIGHMVADIVDALEWVWCLLLGFAILQALKVLNDALDHDWWSLGFHAAGLAVGVWWAVKAKRRSRWYIELAKEGDQA